MKLLVTIQHLWKTSRCESTRGNFVNKVVNRLQLQLKLAICLGGSWYTNLCRSPTWSELGRLVSSELRPRMMEVKPSEDISPSLSGDIATTWQESGHSGPDKNVSTLLTGKLKFVQLGRKNISVHFLPLKTGKSLEEDNTRLGPHTAESFYCCSVTVKDKDWPDIFTNNDWHTFTANILIILSLTSFHSIPHTLFAIFPFAFHRTGTKKKYNKR